MIPWQCNRKGMGAVVHLEGDERLNGENINSLQLITFKVQYKYLYIFLSHCLSFKWLPCKLWNLEDDILEIHDVYWLRLCILVIRLKIVLNTFRWQLSLESLSLKSLVRKACKGKPWKISRSRQFLSDYGTSYDTFFLYLNERITVIQG